MGLLIHNINQAINNSIIENNKLVIHDDIGYIIIIITLLLSNWVKLK